MTNDLAQPDHGAAPTTRAERRAAERDEGRSPRQASGPRVVTLLPEAIRSPSGVRRFTAATVLLSAVLGFGADGSTMAVSDPRGPVNASVGLDRYSGADADALPDGAETRRMPSWTSAPLVPGSPAGSGAVSVEGDSSGTVVRDVVPAGLIGAGTLSGAVPAPVLDAYRRAEGVVDRSRPGCRLPWWLLAGIGKIESGHAAGGRVDAAGTTRGRIVGPLLDGSTPGTAVIVDSDRGLLDGNLEFDRAVGPMQFLPSTWASWSADGNGDGRPDPHNVYDAALAAARYLCSSDRDLSTEEGLRAATLSYNQSDEYVTAVLAWGRAYRDGVRRVAADVGVLRIPPSPATTTTPTHVRSAVPPAAVSVPTRVVSTTRLPTWPTATTTPRTTTSTAPPVSTSSSCPTAATAIPTTSSPTQTAPASPTSSTTASTQVATSTPPSEPSTTANKGCSATTAAQRPPRYP